MSKKETKSVILDRLKMFTNVEYSITKKLKNVFQEVQYTKHTPSSLSREELQIAKNKMNEIFFDEKWLRNLNQTNVNDISLDNFNIIFKDLIKALEKRFESFLQSKGLLTRITYSTILLPDADFSEVKKTANNFYSLRSSVNYYEKYHPKSSLTNEENKCVLGLKKEYKGKIIKEFGANLPPVFLIEIVRVKQGLVKSYLGDEFKKGKGLTKDELEKLAKIYGLTGPTSFQKKCSEHRINPLSEMLYDFTKNDFDEAIIFMANQLEEEQDFFPVSVLQEIINIYKSLFLKI